MNKLGNILWKLFSATMVFFVDTNTNNAIADTIDDPKIKEYFTTSSENASTVTICKQGQYLYACGDAVIGTNWLRGMEKTIAETEDNAQKIKTTNYFSENSEDNFANLRKYFRGQPFHYTEPETHKLKTVAADIYKQERNIIISNFCTDKKGELVWGEDGFICEPCPNNSMVPASTVKRDTYGSGKLVMGSWNIHTIADCYLQEFSDSTGSYIYVTDTNIATINQSGDMCYYTKEQRGSYLYYR